MSLLSETAFLDSWRDLVEDNLTSSCNSSSTDTSQKDQVYKIVINTLVFITVSGISSVVDPQQFKDSFKKPPIYAGASFQFLLMPFIGFITVLIFPFDNLQAIALLVLCASPGGSFSNWWCNLFNADLALSVSMTSLSTVCSIGMLPLNIYVYIKLAFERTQDFSSDSVDVDFADLGLTLGLVIGAVILGLLFGARFPQFQNSANLVGNIAGAASILLGVFASTDTCDGKPPWRQAFFPLWVGTAFPLLFALLGTLFLGKLLGLRNEQRVAISLETAYQNTSIALAYTVSQGDAGRRAAGIPVIYGGYEAGFFLIFMMTSWKVGWTYAPPNTPLRRVLFENWQPGSDNHKLLHPELYPEVKDTKPTLESSKEDVELSDFNATSESNKNSKNGKPDFENQQVTVSL